jgi:S1-C subfamily serine protease
MTTAIVADSQGLGFAVPSNTILREMFALVESGTYEGHPYLGVTGNDMDYELAQDMHVNVTYGWKIAETKQGGPADSAGVQTNDVLIGINGTRVRNGDEMSSYLEENALSDQMVVLSIARGNQTLTLQVVLGHRPPPPT